MQTDRSMVKLYSLRYGLTHFSKFFDQYYPCLLSLTVHAAEVIILEKQDEDNLKHLMSGILVIYQRLIVSYISAGEIDQLKIHTQ